MGRLKRPLAGTFSIPVTARRAGPHSVHYTQLFVMAPGQGKADATEDWQHSEASASSETPVP